jgi:hypothetical protein
LSHTAPEFGQRSPAVENEKFFKENKTSQRGNEQRYCSLTEIKYTRNNLNKQYIITDKLLNPGSFFITLKLREETFASSLANISIAINKKMEKGGHHRPHRPHHYKRSSRKRLKIRERNTAI